LNQKNKKRQQEVNEIKEKKSELAQAKDELTVENEDLKSALQDVSNTTKQLSSDASRLSKTKETYEDDVEREEQNRKAEVGALEKTYEKHVTEIQHKALKENKIISSKLDKLKTERDALEAEADEERISATKMAEEQEKSTF